MLDFARRNRADIYTNGKVEYFPSFTRFTVSDIPVFREPGWEADRPVRSLHKPQCRDNPPERRSISRAKKKIFDIAALNQFQYFVTLTLDGSKINRQSPKDVAHKLKIFLGNKVKRCNLSYILVPEYHSDGCSIHLHGLVSGNLKLTDSGHKDRHGRTVYNWDDWTYGFSTCIKLDGVPEAVAHYITKYVTKDTKKILGNFYYAGGGISRKPEAEYANLDFDDIPAEPYFVPALGINFKYVTVQGGQA